MTLLPGLSAVHAATLGSVLAPADSPQSSYATVVGVHADGTVDLDLGGGRVRENTPALASYVPAMGDLVLLIRPDEFTMIVLGDIASTAPSTLVVASPFISVNTIHKPGTAGATGTLTVPAAATASFRGELWTPGDVFQGADRSGQYGYWYGCYFYGAGAFDTLSGDTATSITITLHRQPTGGYAGPVEQWLAPHAHPDTPDTLPLWTDAPVMVGALDLGQSATFTLPLEWGQALIDGSAAGIGHRDTEVADYCVAFNAAADVTSGRLAIGWLTGAAIVAVGP